MCCRLTSAAYVLRTPLLRYTSRLLQFPPTPAPSSLTALHAAAAPTTIKGKLKHCLCSDQHLALCTPKLQDM